MEAVSLLLSHLLYSDSEFFLLIKSWETNLAGNNPYFSVTHTALTSLYKAGCYN